MGAHNIEMVLDGKLSRSQVENKIEKQRREDRDYNGHQEGYSGDWQTIPRVEFRDKIFSNYEQAADYCLDNAEKWSHAIAVKFKEKPKYSAKLIKMKEAHSKTIHAYRELETKLKTDIKNAKSKTIGCQSCESKVNRSYVNNGSCPVCGESLLSNTATDHLKNAQDKIKKQKELIDQRIKEENEKGDVKWLIAGWAAS